MLYRHPNGDLEAFLVYISHVLDLVSKTNKYCIVTGDFNIEFWNYKSHPDSTKFIDLLGTYFYQPHILQPTRITDHSASLIGNILFNSAVHHTISGNLVYDLTDHLPNFLIINKFSALPKDFKIFKRDYSNFKQSLFAQDAQSINWDFPNENNPIDMFADFFLNYLY